jgi:cell division protein FtsI/penicillin-binding protein 2
MSRIGWDTSEEDISAEDSSVRGRLYLLRLVILLAFVLLGYRVYWLQQTRGPELALLAQENQFAVLRTDAPRG